MDNNANTGSFTNSLNVNSFNSLNILHATIPVDKAQVLQWLSSLEPQKRHQYLGENRLGSVGGWIFRTGEFRRWNTGEGGSAHSVLFCHGDPGVGKTYLSSLVIDHFYESGQNTTVAGLYCDYLDRKEQTIANMLGAMLKQLVGGGSIPEDIRKAFDGSKGHFGGVGPRVPQLLKMLKTGMAQRQRVVICIDGLDELLAAHRASLLSSLQAIARESPNVQLFLTGRPFIRREVERYFPGVTTITVSPAKEDARAFLRMKIYGDTEPDAMDDRLRAGIMETIPEKVSEMFLLVSLSIDAILGETTIHRREEKLKRISKGQGIGDVYTATLARIRAQQPDKSRLGMEAIMWIAHSERPLRPDELCQALGVEIGSKDLNTRNAPSIRTILNCGLGLITVDSSSSTVRLVHFTLQEYILANPTLFHRPHSVIAEVCLTYLNFACIRDLSPALDSPPPATPFLEYASHNWGAHSRRGTNESVISLALKLLNQFDAHISCKLLLIKEHPLLRPFDSEGKPAGFTGLHGGAFLGVADIMVPLSKIRKWDFNATDLHGNTALMCAATKGHDGVVRILLEQESVNPNIADNRGRSPLSGAAMHGHEVIVKTLLERNDVDPGKPDGTGRTPLSWAAGQGYEGIAKMLLERTDVDPDAEDQGGQTPLSWAVGSGCEGILKMLLKRTDVNPNAADKCGKTPLLWAAILGYKGVAELLSGWGVINLEPEDVSGRMPLSLAAENWNVETVKMLLNRRDVNPDTADASGRTPLSWAAEHWNVEIVRILLERSDVSPDRADERGRTPFSWAAVGWADGPDDVDPNTGGGSSGRGQYSWAIKDQCERVAKMLLQQSDVDPDRADKRGRTPFSWAAGHGREEIVKMLLDRSDVNHNTADERGRTPFSWAAMYGHEGVVKMLLEGSDVNPDTPDESGRTPLAWATENGYEGIAQILLERSDANPITPNENGRTPLALAATFGPEEVVEVPLDWNDFDHDTVDKSGQTLFLPASMPGHGEIVDMVLESSAANSGTLDVIGITPSPRAAVGGQEGIAVMRFEPNDVDPDTEDETNRTLYPWAVENGRARAMRMLEGRCGLIAEPALGQESSGSFTTEELELPKIPHKKLRRF